MNGEPEIRALLVEDSPGDARLVEIMLTEGGDALALDHAAELAGALARAAEQAYDVILLDLSLPDSHGLETVEQMLEAAPGTPIVVLTGNADDELALRAVQVGAQDYLVKGEGDGRSIRRAVSYAIERMRSEEALRNSEARFRALFEEAALGILMGQPSGEALEVNPALAEMLGYRPEVMRGKTIADFAHAEERERIRDCLRRLRARGEGSEQLDARLTRRDGGLAWGRMSISLVDDAHGQPLYIIVLVEDVTERREMEDRLRLAAAVFESTGEGIFVTDADGRIIRVNPAFEHLTGYSGTEAEGRDPEFLSSGRHDADFYPRLWAALADQGQWRGEVWNRRKSGELFASWLNMAAVRNSRGEVVDYVAVFSDITARKEAEERLAYLANHDPLTNLANRILLTERLTRALVRARRTELMVGVLFIDLDGFKEVNDEHGHALGDMVLMQVAERLQRAVRPGDTVARLAGDEFTIVLEDMTDFRDAAVVAQAVIDRLGEPCVVEGVSVEVGCSVGISTYPDAGEDAGSLIMAADRAMYGAKRVRVNGYRFFSEEMNSLAVERMTLVRDLHNAVEEEAFRVHYQPRVDINDGRVVGVEALVRWQHPGVGLLPPSQFLQAAEEEGLVSEIDHAVLDAALGQMRVWLDADPETAPERLTVNIAARTLRTVGLPDTLRRLLAEHGVPADHLEIEVKEGDVMDDPGASVQRLRNLQALGLRVAIDDFGTGYSAFGMLRQLPINGLTIAGSFIRNVMTETGDAQIVTAIVALSQSLKLSVVAKGVETPEHLAFLEHHNCDVAQGFLYSRPLPAREMTRVLDEGARLVPVKV